MKQESAFIDQLELLVSTEAARRLVIAGALLTICEDPAVGIPLDNPPRIMWYYIVPEAPAFGIARMTVLYTFDDEMVYLDWVDLSEAQPTLI